MMIPAKMIELHKSNIFFCQPPGHDAIVCKGARCHHIRTIHVQNMLGLVRKIGNGRNGHLHFIGHFRLVDLAFNFRIMPYLVLNIVEALDKIKCPSSIHAIDALWIVEERHRLIPRHELHALVMGRQEATAPGSTADGLIAAAFGDHDDERREIVIHAAEAIAEPGSYARPSTQLIAGLRKNHCGLMVDLFGEHGPHHTDIVCDLSNMGNQVTEVSASSPILLESSGRHGQRK